jgi:DNA-binding response OmpR family regulator
VIGVTELVVDRDPRVRELLVRALRTAGMHALGAYVPADAVALLDGIAADVVLVRSDDEDAALKWLRRRTILIRVPANATVDEAVSELLRALGRGGEAVSLN